MKSNLNSIYTALLFCNFSFLLLNPLVAVEPNEPIIVLKSDQNLPVSITKASPLQRLCIACSKGELISITDGEGNEYYRSNVKPFVHFRVGGILGNHTINILDKKGKVIKQSTFEVEAVTNIDDGGKYKKMFDLFNQSMRCYSATGESNVKWNNELWHFYVHWGLDQCHTMKGMQYFSKIGNEYTDLCAKSQREDGMIWSFILTDQDPAYFETCYGPFGYTRKIGDRYFVRQPTENHPEYLFVETLYQWWKASGNDDWMKQHLNAASKALDYTINDPARWSKRFGLLKRVLTIDSWDFQVNDEYTPKLGLNNTMLVDPEKSKFGIFFGDNTGYAAACDYLSKMYEHSEMKTESEKYKNRAGEIRSRLNQLSWNGNYYIHFIDEDSTVRRNLGVDMSTQIGHSNAYSINRNIGHDKSISIINTYLKLKSNLPEGSPGEWYAIYPAFGKGFGSHNEKWQYMNAGIATHAAGELARGAFESGMNEYGIDILNRLAQLGYQYDNKIYFAYTGAFPTPPLPQYKKVDLTKYSNMDLWDLGGPKSIKWLGIENEPGNDMRNLPVGEQIFQNVPFLITDPSKNNRKAMVAVSGKPGYPVSVPITINDSAKCIYLLHVSQGNGPENICGSIRFNYSDGTSHLKYIVYNKHLNSWWFPEINNPKTKVAWKGKSPVSNEVGVYWTAIDNPNSEKIISNLTINSAEDAGIYGVIGVTLASEYHYTRPKGPSYGGPDNWAAATAMHAMIEGLAGVKNIEKAFSKVVLSPNWYEANADTVNVTVCFPSSNTYVAYHSIIDRTNKEMNLVVTGVAKEATIHLPLPKGVNSPIQVSINNSNIDFTTSKLEETNYVDFNCKLLNISDIKIKY